MGTGSFTHRSNELLAPGDRFIRTAFAEASREVEKAIASTIDILFTNDSTKMLPENLSKMFRFPTNSTTTLARSAEIYERTLSNVKKYIDKGSNLTIEAGKFEFANIISTDHISIIAELSGCMAQRSTVNCSNIYFHSKYRTIDGTCNNLKTPTWGASLTGFRRLLNPIYENGISIPVGWFKERLYNGFRKPSARFVSTSLISTKRTTYDREISHMVMQWGQFLDHDLDHAVPSVTSKSWDGADCKKTCNFLPPCYPILVPLNDARIRNRRCIDFIRSSAVCGSGVTSLFFNNINYREQINQLTSYIDASQVYGYSTDVALDLRNLSTDDGLLRIGVNFPNQGDMLPFAAPQNGIDCRRNIQEGNVNCFLAGDIRVNEQVGLLAMHTIWMREHNRIALILKSLNHHWNGDKIYEESRKIVGAQMQHITFKHWLPHIIGINGMKLLGEYEGYDPSINPSISNEFATAALRFGHTLINPVLHRLNATYQPIPHGNLALHKAFFAPWRLVYEGGVDPLLRGLFTAPAKLKLPHQNLNMELTEKLFHTAHAVDLDLAAINIQRARDHGINGYNAYRKFCNMTTADSFDDLKFEISNTKVRNKLNKLYGHPSNIDLWVGGILEDKVAGGKVGPLFSCLLVEQFKNLRNGDRFYYENSHVFSKQQLAQIKHSNLASVLCANGDNITETTYDVFRLPKVQGGYTKCTNIPSINLAYWKQSEKCNIYPQEVSCY